MRIVIANKYARVTGGADLHCLELARGLRTRGHKVAFLSTADERNVDQHGFFVPTIVTNETRAEARGIRAAQIAGRALWNPSVAVATREMLNSFHPDLMHVHKLYPQLSVAPVTIAARRGVPIVQTLHDYEFLSASAMDHTGHWRDRDEARPAYRSLNAVLFGIKRLIHVPRVQRWISVSNSVGLIYSQHGIPTTVLPNFTEPMLSTPSRFEDRKGVLFFGRLSEEKGLRHVLELARIVPRMPIVIAGDGALASEVRHAEQTLPNVTYLGWLDRETVARELVAARLVIMPSLWHEPAGLAALEAMAAGTPVIAYAKGGLAEYVTNAGGGVVVPPTADLLARAVTSLYDDHERWNEISCRAQSAIKQNHIRDRYLDDLEQIYASVW
jgi:glycosyltransferase involved in cell wall biosynthesis